MSEDVRQELQALRFLADPYRWKVGFNNHQEATICGKIGTIEFHEPTMQILAAYTQNANLIKLWLSLDWIRPHQHADKELRVIFPVEQLEAMADLIRVKTKRAVPRHLEQFHFISRVQGQKLSQDSTNTEEAT